jgi:hypothetical protein
MPIAVDSAALGHLAQLVVLMPAMMTQIVRGIDLDLAAGPGSSFQTTATLLREFDENIRELRTSLEEAAEADFALTWRLLYGGETVRSTPALAKTSCATP